MTKHYEITKMLHKRSARRLLETIVPCMYYNKGCKQVKVDGEWVFYTDIDKNILPHLSSGACPHHFKECLGRLEKYLEGRDKTNYLKRDK